MWWDIIKTSRKELSMRFKKMINEGFRFLKNTSNFKEGPNTYEYEYVNDEGTFKIDLWIYKKYLNVSPRQMLEKCQYVIKREPLFYSKNPFSLMEQFRGDLVLQKNSTNILMISTEKEHDELFDKLDEENTIGVISFDIEFSFDDWENYLNVTDSVFTTREQKLEALKETKIKPGPLDSLTPEQRAIVRGIVEG